MKAITGIPTMNVPRNRAAPNSAKSPLVPRSTLRCNDSDEMKSRDSNTKSSETYAYAKRAATDSLILLVSFVESTSGDLPCTRRRPWSQAGQQVLHLPCPCRWFEPGQRRILLLLPILLFRHRPGPHNLHWLISLRIRQPQQEASTSAGHRKAVWIGRPTSRQRNARPSPQPRAVVEVVC